MTDHEKRAQDAPESADESRRAFIKKAGMAAAAAPAATLILSAKTAQATVSGIPGTGIPGTPGG